MSRRHVLKTGHRSVSGDLSIQPVGTGHIGHVGDLSIGHVANPASIRRLVELKGHPRRLYGPQDRLATPSKAGLREGWAW